MKEWVAAASDVTCSGSRATGAIAVQTGQVIQLLSDILLLLLVLAPIINSLLPFTFIVAVAITCTILYNYNYNAVILLYFMII